MIQKAPLIHAAILVAVVLLLYHFIFAQGGNSAQAADYQAGYEFEG